jgi:RimJ/RimL family protein N-acetyltransferase
MDSRTLESARLLLPPLSLEHGRALAGIYADPVVARYVGGDRLTDELIDRQVAAFADEWAERGYGQSAVISRDSGEFLGRIGLHYWPAWDEVELGYVLGRSAQGKGLAFEGASAWIDWARSAPGIDRLIANIHPDNAASIGLAGRLGFGFHRHDVTPTGLPTLIYELAVVDTPPG